MHLSLTKYYFYLFPLKYNNRLVNMNMLCLFGYNKIYLPL